MWRWWFAFYSTFELHFIVYIDSIAQTECRVQLFAVYFFVPTYIYFRKYGSVSRKLQQRMSVILLPQLLLFVLLLVIVECLMK